MTNDVGRTVPPPGVLAVSRRRPDPALAHDVRAALSADGIHGPAVHEGAGLVVATWGGTGLASDGTVLLSRGPRQRDRDLSAAEVSDLLDSRDLAGLSRVLPPFGAFRRLGGAEAVAATDALGFRHLYWARGADWAALSTSARLLAIWGGRSVDREAITVQALLGWQLGDATLFEGVAKLGAGELARLRDGRLTLEGGVDDAPRSMDLDEAVDAAAEVLRAHLTAYVTDHPDATLQLTGGQDSRILLSAIPPELRRGMRAITLRVPGSPDAQIAARISARTGLRHHVEELESVAAMAPGDALALCVDASRRLEGMADPVALAGLSLVERRFEQGHRIAGLGGEVARGFYYFGNHLDPRVTRARVARLTAWRMFANESIDPAALATELREGSRDRATDRVHTLMMALGKDWLAASDDFYLRQRMQRWAGVTDTAVCLERTVANPMLDDRFIAIAQAMSPRSKRGSRFLARLQMALDPDLGRMPLDGRPSPEVYARPGPANRARAVGTLGTKAVAKARQRLDRAIRPAAGAEDLAAKVVEEWRADPALLHGALEHQVLDEGWVERVVAGSVEPTASTVAFVVNVASLPAVSTPRAVPARR